MGVGVFISVAGLLLPLILFIRILYEVYRLRQNIGAPSCMWRILLLTFIIIPITATLPSVESLFTNDLHGAAKDTVEYMASSWGMFVISSKIMAVLAYDYISPIIMQELGEVQMSPPKRFSLAWFTHDLGLVSLCFAIALLVWIIKFPPW